ncbi:diguanylate cyclase [Aliiglaciecola sp. M165]|uniref:sensor domain-containing diguanylate cyclase n=1 Tax=Aliiglaciecola sp. M165 TaxID=2593649 RepID=UPI00117C1D2E|nr:diguanylate cyclase [Aliiglaciecola sp. M165]TRY33039.1 diguanylate cyclase [Aliiglaciecola sp. M165]
MLLNSQTVRFNQTWSVGLVCVLALFCIISVAQMGKATDYLFEVGKGTLFIEDKNDDLTIENMRALPDLEWEKESNELLSYGMNPNPYWFKFIIPPPINPEPRLLEVDYAVLDVVEIWYFQNGELVAEYHGGDKKPFEERAIKSEKLLFPVPQSLTQLDVIVKIQTAGTVKLPIRIWHESDYLIYNGEHNLVLGLFFGFMAAMTLSNLFFYVTTGSNTFLTYSIYVVSMTLTLLTMHGLGFKYLWPDWIWLQSRSIGIFATCTILFVMIFSQQLLNVKAHSRIMERLLNISKVVLSIALVASFIVPYHYYIMLYLVLLCLSVTLVFATGALLWIKGVKLARFYLLAWSALLVSGFLSSIESADILKVELPAHYLLMFGAAIETFMLAFALAIAYGQQRDEQFKVQELALLEERMARESQEKTLRLQEEAQEDLEYKVQERTLELEIALRELSDTNNELEQQTLTDSLTGIRNRKHFDKKYQAEVRRCRREQTELSVVMLDIDNFKQINDTHGHVVGDEVIINVAKTLKENLKRTTDDACRYGGEEFALILPNTDLPGATLVAETVRKQIEDKPIQVDDIVMNITISAGVATTVVTSAEDEKNLLETADKFLYEAKRGGRNKVVADHVHARDSV